MTTNGFVTVTERSGDLRVGAITSTASDVTLSSPERILDAERGAGCSAATRRRPTSPA